MRILIIEDEKEIVNFIKKGLESEHFAVDVAHEGEKGLWYAKTNDYDVVILDIMLPEKDGIEICKELRKFKKSVPIIMLTVKNELDDKLKAFDAGADDYLTKPFSFEELLARIRALLRRGKVLKDDKLKIANLTLDTKKHIVIRGGKPIKLSKKEFALLEYFMRNVETVLTRAMMLEHVWDMNADPFTNTVDVHVRLLREKIDKKHKRKLIHTVHGYGYKID